MPAEPTPDDVKTVAVALEIVDRPARRNPPWRPTTLTVRKFLKICHLVEQGAAITRACEVECISYARFRFRVSNSPRLQERLKEAEKTRFDRRHEEALESILDGACLVFGEDIGSSLFAAPILPSFRRRPTGRRGDPGRSTGQASRFIVRAGTRR